jgi:hypothetical protein
MSNARRDIKETMSSSSSVIPNLAKSGYQNKQHCI